MKTKQELGFIAIMLLATFFVIYFHAPLIVYGYAFILFVLLCLVGAFKHYQNTEQEATEEATEQTTEEATEGDTEGAIENTPNRSGVIAFCCVVFFIITIIFLHVAK